MNFRKNIDPLNFEGGKDNHFRQYNVQTNVRGQIHTLNKFRHFLGSRYAAES